GSTGTGVSTIVAMPSYQTNAQFSPGGVPSGISGRVIPDLAMPADPNSCPLLFVIDGEEGLVGGTSESSPLTVGLLALLNQVKGTRLGSPNPELYRLGASQFHDGGPGVFIDITDGNNSSPPIPCFPNGIAGQSAGFGYDTASGWGAIDFGQLATFYGASSLPTRPAPAPPSITQMSARLSGDVLSVAVVSTSQGLNVNQATYQLLDGSGNAVGQPASLTLSERHSVLAAYFVNISGLSQAPSALSVTLGISDKFGGASAPMTASFAGADPGGPDIVSASFNGSQLTIRGKRLSGPISLEINGKIVGVKNNGSASRITFDGSEAALNLQTGVNRVRVAGGAFIDLVFSNIFLLTE
ncbi:MAG TPA: hypothetical protein VI756_15545, partial [Blastocatellia bacterium]